MSLRRIVRLHRPLMWFAAAMVVTGAVSAVGYNLDDRILVGVPIWAKPLKFSASFALYAVTLAWLVSRLQRPRIARLAHNAGTVIAWCGAGEMVAIVLQVVRGRESHFDVATGFDSAVFAIMGVLVVAIFLATVVVGAVFLRESPVAERVTTWAVRVGLAISVAGMAVGFLMVAPRSYQGDASPVRGAHSVGVRDGGPAIPLLGWDSTGGDLRVAHFVGLHALQALPLLALALDLVPVTARLATASRVRLMLIGAAGYLGLFVLTLWQALRGQAVLAPDAWTVLAAGVLLAAVVIAAFVVVRGDRPRLVPGRGAAAGAT